MKSVASKHNYIIGAGLSGLNVALKSGYPIFEKENYPGGICFSYDLEGFNFHVGGGHWIYGNENAIGHIQKLSPLKKYLRNSGIFMCGNSCLTKKFRKKIIDYPIQNNLHFLGKNIAQIIVHEISALKDNKSQYITLSKFLEGKFGTTLYRLFFEPFQKRYTDGLFYHVSPSDTYKIDFDMTRIIRGASKKKHAQIGYNANFFYPRYGFTDLIKHFTSRAKISYNNPIIEINTRNRYFKTADGKELHYNLLISSMPLNKLLDIIDFKNNCKLPYVSVLVVNAVIELPHYKCANHNKHWLYVPDSKNAFYRIGYYSNVDKNFLPKTYRNKRRLASIYLEFAFRRGARISRADIEKLTNESFAELNDLGLVKKVQLFDYNWIEVGYTYIYPGQHNEIDDIFLQLRSNNIISLGRYGGWNFKSMAQILASNGIKSLFN